MRKLNTNPNIDNSDLVNYPDGRIKNNTGAGDGTPVDERVYGDIHQTIAYLMRRYGIASNDLPDNVENGYQIVDAFKALPSKNDFIIPLSSSGGILQTNVKLGLLEENEFFICIAQNDYVAETQIKGSDVPLFAVTTNQPFKTGEFVRLTKKSSVIELARLVDFNNIDLVVAAYNYLKAATYSQEIAGTSNLVATNPLSNALAFVERVNGASSSMSLATILRNGLYPKEHFAIIAGLGASPVKNKGWFSGLDINFSGPVGTVLPSSGDVTAKYLANPAPGNSLVEVTMANTMDNINYKVVLSIESEGNIDGDNDCTQFVWKKVSTTVFRVSAAELSGTVQNLKVHIEVVQL